MRWTTFLVIVAALSGCASDSRPPARHEYKRVLMGVQARIVLYAPEVQQAAVQSAVREAFQRIADLEAVMSDYRRDSEAMKLCAQAGEGLQPVSDDLLDIVNRSLHYDALSGGAFDVTVGPLTRLWRAAGKAGNRPRQDQVEAARALVGSGLIEVDPWVRQIGLAKPGMHLDFGGIGKGYACDAAAAVLTGHGLERCLIDMGGDLLVGAAPPGKAGWRIALGGTRGVIHLVRGAVATSGDTERFVEVDGVRYSHIVDPETGMGLTDRSRVTVVARTATAADALASAVSVLGEEAGLALIEKQPRSEVMIEWVTDSKIRRVRSRKFPPRISF